MKAKNILLTTASVLTLGAVPLALISVEKNTNLSITTPEVRNISGNTENKDALSNPNELIYMSEVLNSTTAPVFENGQVNEANLKRWENFTNNVKALDGYSGSRVAQQLAAMFDKIEDVKNLNVSIQNLKDLAETDPLINQMLDILIQKLKDGAGVSEDLSSVDGIDNIPEKLLELSGIVEGTKIKTISALSSGSDAFKKTDLIQDPGVASSSLSIGDVAGTDYKQLIKIAEISASQAGTYALKFKKFVGNQLVSGTLYIKNDANQFSGTAEQIANNLDIFGRWDTSSNNSTVGTSIGYDKLVENFIFQKKNGMFEVLVRVKDGEILQDLEFVNAIAGSSVALSTPSRFGILDVQATSDSTFRSSILGESTTLLADINDTENVISSINFFSDTLVASKVSGASLLNNRQITFYQRGTTDQPSEIVFPMLYNADEISGTINYQKIEVYQNGQPTGESEKFSVKFDGSTPSQFDKSKYSLYTDLKAKLPEEVLNDFVNASTITLKSGVDNNSGFAKQTITFSDKFYALGERTQGWTSINANSEKFGGILVSDPTQKIFLEAPSTFQEPTDFTESTLSAEEQVNERDTVVQFLDKIYTEFSKANGGEFDGQKYDQLSSVTVWTADNGKNIKTSQINLKGNSPYQLYTALNDNWKVVAGLIQKLFNETPSADRYDASQPNVVKNWLAKNTEFSSPKIETLVTNAINIVKEQVSSITPDLEYDILTSETRTRLASVVAELIQEQFTSIYNEFNSKQYNTVYDKLKELLTSTTTESQSVINSPDSILELLTVKNGFELIKYVDGGWDSIASTKTSTLREAVKSLLDLLYFENADGIKLGESIFQADEINQAFNSTNPDSLLSFESDTVDSKKNKVKIFGRIISIITGNADYDLDAMVSDMLSSGEPISSSKLNGIAAGLKASVKNMSSIRKVNQVNSSNSTVESHYLDDMISGTNAIIALRWKQAQLSSTFSVSRSNDLSTKIDQILNNMQFSSSELGIWSNIINGTYDYKDYAEVLSGRGGSQSLEELVNKLISDETLNAPRVEEQITSDLIVIAEDILKYAWWIIIAAIGVGILVSSTVGIATKTRQVKLSSRPVVKWLLISGIVLGAVVAAIAILLGLGIF